MPVRTVRISSLSGDIIPDGTGARLRVIWQDDSRTDLRADLTDAEVAKLQKEYGLEEVEERPTHRRKRVQV